MLGAPLVWKLASMEMRRVKEPTLLLRSHLLTLSPSRSNLSLSLISCTSSTHDVDHRFNLRPALGRREPNPRPKKSNAPNLVTTGELTLAPLILLDTPDCE